MEDTGRQAGDTTLEPASQRLASRHRETSGRHDPGPRWHPTAETARQAGDTTASQHLASDRIDWEASRRHDPGGVQPQRLGDKRETPPRSQCPPAETDTTRSQRHSIWHLTAETGNVTASSKHDPGASVGASGIRAETGRQAGDTTPEPASQKTGGGRHSETDTTPEPVEPASQHLASDQRDWETGRQSEIRTPQSASHFPILYTSS